jgi:hypothetical protein
MEKLSYAQIRLQTNESKEEHNFIIENTKELRWNIEDRALYNTNNLFDKGKPCTICKEASADIDKVNSSRQYDSIFSKDFLENKPGYLIRGLKN